MKTMIAQGSLNDGPSTLARPMTGSRLSADRREVVAWIVVAGLLTMAMIVPMATGVLAGRIGDPDDAMRLVEVRAWMNGQAWFDVGAHRLDPPLGASMHWSRLVDLPVAALIACLRRLTDAIMAERIAMILVPTALLVLLYVGMVRLADVLLGRGARGAALFGTALSGGALVQVAPGRIGHHGPELVLLVFSVAFALEGLDPSRWRRAALAGAFVALSLSLSLETMPLLATLAMALVATWVVRGAASSPALGAFAAGLAATLVPVFLATVAPGRWFAPVCDAYGMAYLGAGLIGAAGLLVLSRATSNSRPVRLVTAATLGALILGFVAIAYPGCLHSPFAGVDPFVRTIWLDNVVESLPLAAFARRWPMLAVAVALPVALGLVGCVAAMRRARGIEGAKWAVLACVVAVGLALGCVQVRVLGSVTPLALCGGLFVVARVRASLVRRGLSVAAAAAPIVVLPFTGTAWAMLANDPAPGPSARSCLTSEAIAPLAELPPGRMVAPIDAGSHILATTRLDVFAAPYHRDNDGNRFALDVFSAGPATAASLLASREVSYVATCPGLKETATLAARAPDSLAAALLAGHAPAYLRAVPLAGTPFEVFAVRRGQD